MRTVLFYNFLTLKSAIVHYPIRWYRLLLHFVPLNSSYRLKSTSVLEWIVDLIFYIFDVSFIPDLYELISIYLNRGTRSLNLYELELVDRYFGSNIRTDNLRINNKMSKRVRNFAHAFVSFHTINFQDTLSPNIFVHELVHIWQYQKFGSVYIYRALKAQRSKAGYNYGGVEALYNSMLMGKPFIEFNFEQQGEIFGDYAYLQECSNQEIGYIERASFEYYVNQVRI